MPKKILLIEDNEDIQDLLQAGLQAKGYDIHICGDGLQGLDTARKENPDLIILDVMLPRMDGYNVCRMLKFDKNYQHIPIILISAREGDKTKEIVREIKADAYIKKPFDWEDLLKVVEQQFLKKEA